MKRHKIAIELNGEKATMAGCASDLLTWICGSCLNEDACSEEKSIRYVKAGTLQNDAKEKRLYLLNIDYNVN